MVGNPGSRSLQGSHPYWLGNDRVMADEFFRPYFGSGIYANGEVLPGLWYQAVVSNNNSALGVKATQLDCKMTTGASIWWMPTTREFGPRGAYGDWEWHGQLATRFGISAVSSPEQSFRDSGDNPANTIENADYQVVAVDAGAKYKGLFLQAEYFQRRLDNLDANGVLPVQEIVDAGFGDSSEYILGMTWHPWPTRNHRLNLQLMDVNKSPVSSTFGYYTGGQDGWTLATAFSVFF